LVQVTAALDLEHVEVMTLLRNSIEASFASPARKRELLDELTTVSAII
jgi:adenosine deaminase